MLPVARWGSCKPFKGRSWPTLRMAFAFFVISGEQLSLNIVDDSAKTLSVLGNMRGALDDYRLRFVQKCRRPPLHNSEATVIANTPHIS